MHQKLSFTVLFILSFALTINGQDKGSEDALSLSDEQLQKPLTVDLDNEIKESEKKEKKVKRKKNVFYGIKTKKYFVKTGTGERTIFETFHFLKEYQEVDAYVRDIYWYDYKSGKIKKNRNIDLKNGVILHGPYEKYRLDGTVLEKGIFYKGTKHGRWTKYDNKNVLLDKNKYYKGWPKESLVSYYDKDRTKLKEITPIEYGKKEGNYFLFHDNGMVAVSGEYQNNERVNLWREYYKFRRRKKKEVQFKPNPYEKSYKTYIVKEWNEKGELIYDRSAYLKKIK